MGESKFRTEDGIGLGAAIVLHLLLVVALAMQIFFTSDDRPMPERVTVNLASEVSLEATAPNPASESRAAIAPTLSDQPAPEVVEAPVEARPEAPVQPPPTPRTARRPAPETPAPNRDRSRPDRTPERTARSSTNSGGSRIGDNFLEGQGSSTETDNTTAPAATFGRRERAALASAITRQLRPHWTAPTGVDAEKLVSIVSWRLNQDGTLRGRPTCRTQPSSITASNRPQAGLHCERAIRAVQLAAPFNLPEQFYSRWDDLEWQFDRRL